MHKRDSVAIPKPSLQNGCAGPFLRNMSRSCTTIVASQAYTVSAEILNEAGWKGVNSGHPGLLFNAIDENNFDFVYLRYNVGGDRGAGARENRGREGYGRRERKGREAGVLRGRAAGEKYETLIFLIQQCVRILSKTRTQNIRANYNAGLD